MNLLRRRTPLTVDSFEFIPATSDHGLVRVRGSWRRAADRPTMPVLVAEQAGVVQRFTALPDPEAGGTVEVAHWRAAFALPLELLRDGGTSYHLEDGAGRRFGLPTPVEALPDGRPSQERERFLPERRRAPDRRLGRDRRQRPGTALLGKVRRVQPRRREADRRRRSQAELRAFVERIAELRGQVEQLRETRRQFEARMKELEAQLEHARSGEAVGEAEQRTG